MYKRTEGLFFFFIVSVITLVSCQKEIDGALTGSGGGGGVGNPFPTNQKPKVGTTWTYRYYIYHQDGSLYQASIMTHRAKTEETIAGEKWLNIVDVNTDTTVYYLQAKADGLYQYANSNSNMFCKYPASAGDNYITYNEGGAETFYVQSVNDTLPTGIGNVLTNYYEGFKSGIRIDLIWYNNNAWIVRKTQYRNRSLLPPPIWYKYSTLFLDQITF